MPDGVPCDTFPEEKPWEESLSGRLSKQLEEWEEEYPMGTRILKKLARNSRRKKMSDEYQ
jgi:hypothetical protein